MYIVQQDKLFFIDIRGLAVFDSPTHKLELKDQTMIYLCGKWLRISILLAILSETVVLNSK